VITRLMCNFHVDRHEVEERFGVRFAAVFAAELEGLAAGPARDGLVQLGPESIDVTARGRLFVRNVCMVFDRFLRARAASEKPVFSRTV